MTTRDKFLFMQKLTLQQGGGGLDLKKIYDCQCKKKKKKTSFYLLKNIYVLSYRSTLVRYVKQD